MIATIDALKQELGIQDFRSFRGNDLAGRKLLQLLQGQKVSRQCLEEALDRQSVLSFLRKELEGLLQNAGAAIPQAPDDRQFILIIAQNVFVAGKEQKSLGRSFLEGAASRAGALAVVALLLGVGLASGVLAPGAVAIAAGAALV